MTRKRTMTSTLHLHWRMLAWLFTGQCPVCRVKGGHKATCLLPEDARKLA